MEDVSVVESEKKRHAIGGRKAISLKNCPNCGGQVEEVCPRPHGYQLCRPRDHPSTTTKPPKNTSGSVDARSAPHPIGEQAAFGVRNFHLHMDLAIKMEAGRGIPPYSRSSHSRGDSKKGTPAANYS